MRLEYDRVAVEWVYLDEGWSGDYDPSDPEDTPLLRFDVYVRDENGEWADPGGASYCTRMPVTAAHRTLLRALVAIAFEANDNIDSGFKRAMERMSWICPEDFFESDKEEGA